MESLTLSIRGPKASASLCARWPQVHNCHGSYRQTRTGSKVASFSAFFAFRAVSRSKSVQENWTSKLPHEKLVITGTGGHFLNFYRGCLHHTEKENVLCFIMRRWSNFIGSHQTHAFGQQNTHIISETLSKSYKWLQINCNCKSHHYTPCRLHTLPQLGCLPSDVCGCLTSPAWALVSLSPPQTQALTQTHLRKHHYCRPLIQTVLVCTPYPLTLWSLCYKPYRAEHAMVEAFDLTKQLSLCPVPVRLKSLCFSTFVSTSKGMSQLLCQHWAPEYVLSVSLTQCSYHRLF